MADTILSAVPSKRRKYTGPQQVKNDTSSGESRIFLNSNFKWRTENVRAEKYIRDRNTSKGEHQRRNITKKTSVFQEHNDDANYGDRTSRYNPVNANMSDALNAIGAGLGITKRKKYKDSTD